MPDLHKQVYMHFVEPSSGSIPCTPDCPICKSGVPVVEKLVVAEINKRGVPTGRQITFSAALAKKIKQHFDATDHRSSNARPNKNTKKT